MDLMSGIDSVLDSGAVQAAVDVGSDAGFWDGVTNFATEAFNWIGDNPEAANLIGGVAMGVGQAYLQGEQAKSQQAFEREMYDRRRRDEMATPGQINGYSSHLNRIAGKGLLTSGMITGDQEDG
ncbi:hypothetical protein HPA02_27110 [Bisbaumannia pacifica]|uniref:Uncharacterized protein n=1 Tax=Bisbaumannia pacifica TaxID=77098 RepID=A0A510XAI3_9GAMM|nr:hypothetical protein [Halomonas pacifica]GEK48428.1 hypothetical protein HPA02_27110 [Halomonas pacifica]